MPFRKANDEKAKNGELFCFECKMKINEVQNYFECDGCKIFNHSRCANIHGAHINRLANEENWFCKLCKLKRKADQDDDENFSPLSKKLHLEEKISMSDKMDRIIEFLSSQQQIQNDLKMVINNVNDTVANIQKNQNMIATQIKTLNSKMESITVEHTQFKKDLSTSNNIQSQHSTLISQLQTEVDTMKQKDLDNNIIIAGLPELIEPKNAVSNILSLINAEITLNEIKDIKVISRNNNKILQNTSSISHNQNIKQNNTNMTLLVTFTKNEHKEKFMKKKIEKGIIFLGEFYNSNDDKDKLIYIRENITDFKMKLFRDCKTFKLAHNIKFLWTKGTHILMRQEEHSKVHRINNQNDLLLFEETLNVNKNINNN